MRTIRIHYKNGNTLDQKVYAWKLEDGYLYFTTRVGAEMAHPVAIRADNIERIEEL